MDLREYEQRKFALAEILRAAQELKTSNENSSSEASALLARLAEDRFNLLVVGRFSRGKSTLMNALLGGDYLPTGIVPLTSVITTVRYGSQRQVVLNFINSGLPQEVPLARLPEYVTQQGNPGNARKIAFAEIQLPVELLRRGFYFVDTPGLGSAIIENTLTTERFLPQADAFILVTSYESPLSEEEDRILQRIRNANKRLFVVLNKQDTIRNADRETALQFVRERLQQFSFAEVPEVFSISARQALEARVEHREDALASSGLPAFEETLLHFLTEERAQAFLVSMFERTTAFILEQMRLGDRSSAQDRFGELAQRLREKREMILQDSHGAEDPKGEVALIDTTAYPLEVDRKTGCHVCGVIVGDVFEFLSKYQYELVTHPEEQHEHAKRGGFCSLHTWQYEAIASPQGVSESYPKLVDRVARAIRDIAVHGPTHSASQALEGLLSSTATCRVCQVRMEAERRATADVAMAAQRAVDGETHVAACCVHHLSLVINALGEGDAANRLLRSHAVLLERTAEDLQRYTLKHYAVRRYLASQEERRASKLALLLLAGHRNVVAPWTNGSAM